MKNLIAIFGAALFVLALFSCSTSNDSTNDEYIRINKQPEKLNTHPLDNNDSITLPEIHKKNIFVVLINKNDKILSGIGSATDIIEINEDGLISSSLKESIKAFITNNGENPNSSDSPQEAVVSLQNAKNTKYKTYILVQNELTKAYNELRNEKSILDYGKEFDKLDVESQKTIKDYYPMNISEADVKAN